MTRAHEIYRAAHMLPDGPFSEEEKVELRMALHFIRAALGDVPKSETLHADAYMAGHYGEIELSAL